MATSPWSSIALGGTGLGLLAARLGRLVGCLRPTSAPSGPGDPASRPLGFDRQRYRERNLVERCFNQLKQFRAVATRYDKRAVNYRAVVVELQGIADPETPAGRSASRSGQTSPSACLPALASLLTWSPDPCLGVAWRLPGARRQMAAFCGWSSTLQWLDPATLRGDDVCEPVVQVGVSPVDV